MYSKIHYLLLLTWKFVLERMVGIYIAGGISPGSAFVLMAKPWTLAGYEENKIALRRQTSLNIILAC